MEAAASSHLNAQRAEVNNAHHFVTSLRGSLDSAEQLARTESSQNRFIEEQAVAEVASLRATSKQNELQNIGRVETEAQSTHDNILNQSLREEEN